MNCFDPGGSYDGDRWFAVWSIALGSFALVFSEPIPVGLLPYISRGLRSLDRAGRAYGGRAGPTLCSDSPSLSGWRFAVRLGAARTPISRLAASAAQPALSGLAIGATGHLAGRGHLD